MWLPIIVRICCAVVMAPALAKAVNNAEDCYLSIESGNLSLNYQYISSLNKNCSDSIRLRFWISFICPLENTISGQKSNPVCADGVDDSLLVSQDPTMNRDISLVRDNMGLLSANTSLDSDFKVQPDIEHQSAFSTVEQELLVMSPREFENPPDLPNFEIASDNVENPLTPPASRPGSVPMYGASTARSPEDAKKLELQNIALQKRTESIIKRLRNLQTRQIELHITTQLRSLVSHQQKILGIPCQKQTHRTPNRRLKDSMNLKTELLQNEDVRNLSTAALVKLVRKLESHSSTKLMQLQKGVSSDTENRAIDRLSKINSEECAEINRVSGTLISNLQHLKSFIDLDATDSSSGGESCDEFEDSVDKKTNVLSIHRRAEWKWAVHRAAVARRWTWLQAQVSDLEYRIRQQNEICCQLRAAKHCVTLDENIPIATGNAFSSVSLKMHPSKRKHDSTINLSANDKGIGNNSLVGKHLSKSVNGILDSGSNGYHSVCGVLNANSNSMHCTEHVNNAFAYINDGMLNSSRTRPLKSFKKRKLFRTTGLHLINRKAAALTTVRCNCNCQCEMSTCALCGGRYNSMLAVNSDTMPVVERIALLDSSFHPILSFEHDIPLDLTLEKLIKRTEISKSANQLGLHKKRKQRISIPTKGLNNHTNKHSYRLARNAAQTLLSSAKLRKNFCNRKRQPCKKPVNSKERRNKVARKRKQDFGLSLFTMKKRSYRRRTLSVSSGSSKAESPVPSPTSMNIDVIGGQNFGSSGRSSILQDMLRRRRGESAFDINNIVIPHSIASSTRVEKLQYKEIITPKWRIMEDKGPLKIEEIMKMDEEDISDEAYAERHQICEVDEKKKFVSSYRKAQAQTFGRSRSRSRGDRADSSGANTPDPLSPHQLDILGQDSNSGLPAMVSSPTHVSSATPIFFEDSQSSSGTPVVRSERKRTTSFSKKDKMEDRQWEVDEPIEIVAPYEPYVFPLSDDIYEELLKLSPHLIESPFHENVPLQPFNEPVSPISSSSSSLLEEDPSDPEWTVISERGTHQSLILKLAKR